MHISYPDMPILLGTADIKSCFRFARIHADLTGAFGFNVDGFFNFATAMVFGSKASASSWEPFHGVIENLSVIYADCPDLVAKHKHYLDMIKWTTLDPSITPTRAKQCPINLGVRDAFGMTKHLPVQIYVDDALLMATAKTHMDLVLAALIKSIFVVMGEPNTTIR